MSVLKTARLPIVGKTQQLSQILCGVQCLQDRLGRKAMSSVSSRQRRMEKHWYTQIHSPWQATDELADHLVKTKIYEDENVLVLNKPNSLPMFGVKYKENSPFEAGPITNKNFSVMAVKSEVERQLGTPELHNVYTTNRLYSGPIVFIKNKKLGPIMSNYFKDVKINKRYFQKFLAVTTGIPTKSEGEEEIFFRQAEINDYILSVKVEDPVKKHRKRRGDLAMSKMKYSTLLAHPQTGCSLVQLQPTNVKWDSPELYLVHKFCPVLGDHRYSSRLTQIMGKPSLRSAAASPPEPQNIPESMSEKLSLMNTNDHASVPLHFHCNEIILPDLRKKNNLLVLEVPLPDFFEETLRRLGLDRYKELMKPTCES